MTDMPTTANESPIEPPPAQWILLVPAGTHVDVRTSGAVTEPILASQEQLQRVALAATKFLAAGLEVPDVGLLLAAVVRSDQAPTQPPAEHIAPVPLPAGDAVSNVVPIGDRRMWNCACSAIFTTATGGPAALAAHQATCGVFQTGVRFPPENRIPT